VTHARAAPRKVTKWAATPGIFVVFLLVMVAAPARGAEYSFIQEVPVGGSWPITLEGNGTANLTLYLKDGSLWYTTLAILQPGLPTTINFPSPDYVDDTWSLDLNVTEGGISVHHTLLLKTYCNITCQRAEWDRERVTYISKSESGSRFILLVFASLGILLLAPGALLRTHELHRHRKRDRDIPLSWRLRRPRWFLQPHESSKGGDSTLTALQTRENSLEALHTLAVEMMEVGKYGENVERATARGKRMYGLVSPKELRENMRAMNEHRLKYKQALITLRRSLEPPLISPGVPRSAVAPVVSTAAVLVTEEKPA